MAHDLTLTRIGMAEHAYPTPSRNNLSEQQRRRQRPTPKASEVRIGYRSPEGQTIMALTDSEVAERRAADLANKVLVEKERKARMMQGYKPAETDSWAHKS